MRQLSIYLPPFAGDYSGVCSALFDFNCLIIIQDAACCTRNYVDYDEPRWSRTKRTTLCAQLRTIDAILGNDQKLVDKAVEAARQFSPDFIALLGSPVPALIGTDFPGIAREVEALSGRPALGFATTGFAPYHRGIGMAMEALCRRFALPWEGPRAGVNVLGLTPLDFGAVGSETRLGAWLEDAGLSLNCALAMGCSMEEVTHLSRAQVSLVVSRGGLPAARLLEARFGIPWVAGVPVNGETRARLAALLWAAITDGHSRVLQPESGADRGTPLLIVGEQVAANSLRCALTLSGRQGPITVASLFGLDQTLALGGDLDLTGESQLLELLAGGTYAGVIADPLITGLPHAQDLWRGEWVHPAVSSNLCWDRVPVLLTDETDTLLEAWAGRGAGAP